MSLPVNEIVTESRRALDEYTLTGELIAFDADFEDTASSNFSDEDLQDRSLDGVRYISGRVRAMNLPELILSINPTDGTKLTGSDPILRILGSRVKYNGIPANRRTFSAHLSADGLAPSATRPVYIYEDHEFVMNVGSGDKTSDGSTSLTALAGATADVVIVPMFGGVGTSFDGVTWAGTAKTLPLTDAFRAAVVYYVVSSCFQTLRLPELAATYRENLYIEIGPFLRPQFSANDVPEIREV